MLKPIERHPAVVRGGAWGLGRYLAFVHRTTRWTLHAEEAVAALRDRPGPVVGAFWHERLPLMPRVWIEARRQVPHLGEHRATVLISHHRDGRLIADIVRRFPLDVVRGSSSKAGTAGLMALVKVLHAGRVAIITPDGPRGPCRVAAPGVARLAAGSGAPVFACAAATSRGLVLRSWDRMVVPFPFGRGALVIMPPIVVTRGEEEDALLRIAKAMTAAADRADAIVGRRRH